MSAPPVPEVSIRSIHEELAQLQQIVAGLPEGAERQALCAHLSTVVAQCESIQVALARAVFAQASADDGMDVLLDLLQSTGDKQFPGGHMAGLLAPLHRQMQFVGSEISHLLYELLANEPVAPGPEVEPLG